MIPNIKKGIEFLLTFICVKCGMQFRDTREEKIRRGGRCKVCSGDSWIDGW